MKKIVILPSNNDLNRGDQALIWETVKVAKKAGYKGEYYMLAENESLTKQSQDIGLKVIPPILKHPGRKFKNTDNSSYTFSLIIKWGIVALLDLFKSLLLMNSFTKKIGIMLLNDEEKFALNTIKNSDACFVKGGGFIHSSGKITDPYTVYYSLFHIKLAQSLGKSVYIMPNSFGPFKGFGVEKMVKKTLSRCKLVTVRESISSKMLDDIGINHIQYPDLGFFLTKETKKYNEIDELRNSFKEYKLVGITARPYRFPSSDNPQEKYKKYIDDFAHFCEWLFENKYLPVFIDHTLSHNTHESDRAAIDEICLSLKRGTYTIISNNDYTCRDLKAIYSMLDYVIGTRFHSVIFSLSEKIPSIAVTYGGNKGQGIMKDLGLEEYAIPMSEFDCEEVIRMFNLLVLNNDQIIGRLKQSKVKLDEEYSKLVLELTREL